MASIPTTATLRLMRLRDANGYMSHAMFARVCDPRYTSVFTLSGPISGLVRGRIVPISRGSPPPKKR
ncbi:MAG TPA: hypothetical protein VKV19_05630 [Ktedonobacteraceae bacterium]|jgi:hypothetical protein|nr:hypothetical protein [Ktedonobacteraceae bacterium]